jgi:hypothetical protein
MELTRSRGQLRGFQDGISKHIEIDRDATVKALLDRVVALFGNIPAPRTLDLPRFRGQFSVF